MPKKVCKKTTRNGTKTAISTDVKAKKKMPGRPFKRVRVVIPLAIQSMPEIAALSFGKLSKMIAKKKKLTPEEVEAAIHVAGIDKALKDSFLHYAEVSNSQAFSFLG